LLFQVSVDHPCRVFMDVCFVLFLFCLSPCVCVCDQVQGPLRKCPHSGRFRACCTPLVCNPDSDVIGGLAVWRQNNNNVVVDKKSGVRHNRPKKKIICYHDNGTARVSVGLTQCVHWRQLVHLAKISGALSMCC